MWLRVWKQPGPSVGKLVESWNYGTLSITMAVFKDTMVSCDDMIAGGMP